MRTIKFRAWDGSRMLWRGLFDRNWYNGDKSAQCIKGIHPSDEVSLKVMQFTGLKDANGVDIYEEDVVKSLYSGNHEAVRFGECVIYDVEGYESGFFHGLIWFGEPFGADVYGKTSKYEVIGNIHQNPKLLKVEP